MCPWGITGTLYQDIKKKKGIICLFWVCQDQAWALCFSEFTRTGLCVSVPLVHYLYLYFCYCTKGLSISSLSVQNLQLLIKNADLVFFPQLHKSVQCAEETLEAAFLVKHHRWFFWHKHLRTISWSDLSFLVYYKCHHHCQALIGYIL